MAVNSFVACLLWIISFTAWAEEDPMFINKQQEDEIINLAYIQMRESIEELERKIDECRILVKATTLDPALFDEFSLTKQEAITALGYFVSLAQSNCEGKNLWATVAMEFAQFKNLEIFYKGQNIIKTEYDFELICCMISTSHFKTKWRYLQLPPQIRKKLERIPALQKPFNFVITAKKMGLI
ncbi:MAG: hypothetical protein L3J89_11355 [Gammaproteobacteria bacterium]|nr:hypothetical protein [Gammaproteobacteria bacterium]